MLNSGDTQRKVRREHGFQLPLHPLQVSGWLALAVLSAGTFLLLVPALPLHLQPAALATISTLLLLHLAAHLSAALLDPAEPALRKTLPEPLPELDRSKHAHVIEEGLCHLCRIRITSTRTKHCSACNKCVAHFDHHCKWLNHCVGGRNYGPFLMCVSTAVVAAAFVAILAIAELVLHNTDHSFLNLRTTETLNETTTANTVVQQQTSSLQTSDAAFLAVVAALGLLALITAGLLLHLCFFHIYISFLGLTTYEYIRQQRQTQTQQQALPNDPPRSCASNLRYRPANLHCQERSRMTVLTCAVLEETYTCTNAEPTPTPPTTPQDSCQMCVVANTVHPEQQRQITPIKKVPNKQKWNCCASVPDSPDDPHSPSEPRCLMSLCKHKLNSGDQRPRRTHGHWSSAKIRMLFRVLGNIGQSRRRNSQSSVSSAKTNQVMPLSEENNGSVEPIQTISNLVPASNFSNNTSVHTNNFITSPTNHWTASNLQSNSNCNNYHSSYSPSYYTTSDQYSAMQNYNGSTNQSNLTSSSNLPQSNARRIVQLPQLPPPQRRRLISETELANALTILQQQQQQRTSGARRPFPQYRRRRRSTGHRPKTPALSPIRESGLSNPASPSRQNCAVATLTASCTRPF